MSAAIAARASWPPSAAPAAASSPARSTPGPTISTARLRGAARPQTLPPLDPVQWGLKPIELELWQGFVFVRFKPSAQPPVADILAPFADEVAHYRTHALAALPGGGEWTDELPVNWKAVRDVDNEGYHVPRAHPGLQDLYGHGYSDEPFIRGASRSFAPFNDGPGSLWSVRKYKKLLPEVASLPESHRRAWLYVGFFPNTVLTFYPDSVMFYQEFPLAIDRTLQRGRSYRLSRRDPRAARRPLPVGPDRPDHRRRGRPADRLVQRGRRIPAAMTASSSPTWSMACAATTTICAG